MKPFDREIDVQEGGTFRRGDYEAVQRYLRFYAGRTVRVRLSAPKRSTKANAYYWGVVIETIRLARLEVGMKPVASEDLHRHFKRLYLPPRTVEVFGVSHTWESSTVTDSASFFAYVEAIKGDEAVLDLLAAANMHIPEPDTALRSYRIAEPASV